MELLGLNYDFLVIRAHFFVWLPKLESCVDKNIVLEDFIVSNEGLVFSLGSQCLYQKFNFN